ncbi:hypothetical protein [Streptomyces uncialis]|uniref:hypothetical protein n=1 Tax=Streptomyces uncialis TaxID=1048205 RepID=UPI003866F320|nr:ribbon-helix-helix domain-containing protein [Streptomyces uncialis]WTE12834.1 ribbon-helix-helix domain-containing protein [Streptomyces uncialis]
MAATRAGTTENISVSMPSDLASALRARAGRRGVSSYIAEAVRHQLAMDGLAEIVASHETEHGPLTDQEIDAAHREMFGEADGGAGQDAA